MPMSTYSQSNLSIAGTIESIFCKANSLLAEIVYMCYNTSVEITKSALHSEKFQQNSIDLEYN